MIEKKSAGVIIFWRQDKKIEYLLLHHGGSYWNFPKGTQESGETDRETALRELAEETGITDVAIIDDYVDQYQYDFDTVIAGGAKETIFKTVIFFLGEVTSKQVTISHEHLDFGWFDYETAKKRMFYQQGRDIIKRAHQFLLSQQDFVL